MFCPKCGGQVDNGQPFCPKCGTPLQQAAPSYPAQPQYAPRPPMDLSKIMMWVALGAMAITIILSFFGFSEGRTIAFDSVYLITALNLFGIGFMLMPLLGFAKKGSKINYLVLLCASIALITILLNWIVGPVAGIFGSMKIGACGIIALILQLGAVVCCSVMFYLGLEHKAPRAPRQPYPGYPQQPQYPPQPQQPQYPQYPPQP